MTNQPLAPETRETLDALAQEVCPTCGGSLKTEGELGKPLPWDCMDCRDASGKAAGFRYWRLNEKCVCPCHRGFNWHGYKCEDGCSGYVLPPEAELAGVLMEMLKKRLAIQSYQILMSWLREETTLVAALAAALLAQDA